MIHQLGMPSTVKEPDGTVRLFSQQERRETWENRRAYIENTIHQVAQFAEVWMDDEPDMEMREYLERVVGILNHTLETINK